MDDGAGWKLAADAQDVALPPTVQAIYAGQLDDLPPSARSAARRAAVAGRRFPFAALDPLAVEEPATAVATLVQRALVSEPVDDPILGASYVYRHALLRDAGYASLARAERSSLHARFADWLATFPDQTLPTLAEVIARHYAAAVESSPTLIREIEGRTPAQLGPRRRNGSRALPRSRPDSPPGKVPDPLRSAPWTSRRKSGRLSVRRASSFWRGRPRTHSA